MNKFKSLISWRPPPLLSRSQPLLSTVTISDISDQVEDVVFNGQFSIKWLRLPRVFVLKLDGEFIATRSLCGEGSWPTRFDCLWNWRRRLRVCALTVLKADMGGAAESLPWVSGSGWSVPPPRTVLTAFWQTCQLPVERRPTAPLIGLTVRPQASKSKLRNIAVEKTKRSL